MMTRKEIEQLFRSNYASMHGLAYGILHDDDAAKDIVHDIFASILSNGLTSVTRSYLMQSVRNGCVNHIRNLSTKDRLQKIYALDISEIDDEWNKDAAIEEIRRIVDEIPSDNCRNIMRLRFTDGKSCGEIAEMLNMSKVAIYKHLNHAIDIIRKKLEEDE